MVRIITEDGEDEVIEVKRRIFPPGYEDEMSMAKRPTYAWCFKSSSSGKLYQTIRYTDGSLSCDCMGWTRRTAPDGSRTCKHVRSVLLGMAQVEAVRHNALNGSKDLPDSFPVEAPKPQQSNAPLKRKLAL